MAEGGQIEAGLKAGRSEELYYCRLLYFREINDSLLTTDVFGLGRGWGKARAII